MIRSLILLYLSLGIFSFYASSQGTIEPSFVPPLDIPLKLSGTFGELRSNHFHSGMDLKTGEREGLNIYAIEEGYVSRIKVQSGGYGKALYITHPQGLVSVYAHLSKYNSTIEKFVLQKQYAQQSYEVDLYLKPEQLPVERAEIIAYSGNTGRSGGPHLHFEIRDAKSQKPINPLLFGFEVSDRRAPVVNVLRIYPLGSESTIQNQHKPKDFYPVVSAKKYHLKNRDTLEVSGRFYCGVNTYDPFNGGINKNGVYSIQLYADNELVYGHKLETFSFSETRYINSLIDYSEYKLRQRRIQQSWIEPNNKLGIYNQENREGLVVPPGKILPIRYEIADIAGNMSVLEFVVRGVEGNTFAQKGSPNPYGQLFEINKKNVFETDEVTLEIPGRALYDTLQFIYLQAPAKQGMYSPIHRLHNDRTPLHKWCPLSIKAENLPEKYQSKALIVKIEEDGDLSPFGGSFSNGAIHSKIRELGDFCILVDTIPPIIKPLNIKNNKSLLAQTTIRVKVTDALSGIETYNAYLDDRWILMEYDEKNDLLVYRFDQHLKDGENKFKLVVTDERGNIATYEAILNY